MTTKLTIALALLSAGLLTACNAGKEDPAAAASKVEEPIKGASPVNCYQYTGNADTIILKLIHVGESITGTLVYKLSGKDKNQGTIQGAMQGDLFVARYTFMSEGIQSARQVAFKLKDGGFVEGYGESEIKNDIPSFKNLGSLAFNESMKLVEYNCK